MSVIDDLRSAQQQALTRLNELEPLVAEYEELRREVTRLGLTDATFTDSAAVPARANGPAASRAEQRRANRRRATSGNGAGATQLTPGASTPATTAAPRVRRSHPKRSRSSSRVDDITRLVAQQPGVTVAELGRMLGVEATSLYRPVRRLISERRLRKDGTTLHPATP
jgi:hypothetical protein